MSDRIICVAKIVREHGLPKGGRVFFKAQLSSPGGSSLKTATEIFVSSSPDFESYDRLGLLETAPLGGSWGQSDSVILGFDEIQGAQISRGLYIGLLRSQFPVIEDQNEVYLCDLLGLKILNEEKQEKAVVEGFEELAKRSGVNLICRALNAQEQNPIENFSVPLRWVDWQASRLTGPQPFLLIPDLEEWMNL